MNVGFIALLAMCYIRKNPTIATEPVKTVTLNVLGPFPLELVEEHEMSKSLNRPSHMSTAMVYDHLLMISDSLIHFSRENVSMI